MSALQYELTLLEEARDLIVAKKQSYKDRRTQLLDVLKREDLSAVEPTLDGELREIDTKLDQITAEEGWLESMVTLKKRLLIAVVPGP